MQRITYRPEFHGDQWVVRQVVDGRNDKIIPHAPFTTQAAAEQYCRLLMKAYLHA